MDPETQALQSKLQDLERDLMGYIPEQLDVNRKLLESIENISCTIGILIDGYKDLLKICNFLADQALPQQPGEHNGVV